MHHSKTRELLILRHAKSDWESGAPSDFERPLNSRGMADAPRIGEWLKRQGLVPEQVVSSPAQRARSTLEAVARQAGVKHGHIQWDERVYMADLPALLEVLGEVSRNAARVLLVGHNPGLEDLVVYLAGEQELPDPPYGFFKTANLARLRLPDDWRRLPRGCGELLTLVGPKTID